MKGKGKERKGKTILKLRLVSFGRILGPFCPILAQFVPSWGYLGSFSGPTWGYLGLRGAILSHLWGQEVSRTPRPEMPVACLLRFQGLWGPVWGPKLVHFLLFLGSCFGPVFGHVLEHFWTNFGDPFWDQMGLRWAKMGSTRPLRASKSQKPAFAKSLKHI